MILISTTLYLRVLLWALTEDPYVTQHASSAPVIHAGGYTTLISVLWDNVAAEMTTCYFIGVTALALHITHQFLATLYTVIVQVPGSK